MINEHSLTWRESSYSGPDNGDCVESADGLPGAVPVRGGKNPGGPAPVFPARAWNAFTAETKGRARP